MKTKKKQFVIYQITNLLNNHIYIGAHSTYNPYDKYMGSSKYLKKDLKELGRHNFKKDILFIFDNKTEMVLKEAELVNKEFCYRIDTYNKMVGGISDFNWRGMIVTKDINGNIYSVYNDDPRYLSGELAGIAKGNSYSKGLVSVKDKYGNTFSISNKDERYLSGELFPVTKDLLTVKDKEGNIFSINNKDERYLSGELVSIWKDRKHSEESKKKIGEKNSKKIGEKNSMYGRKHSDESKKKISASLKGKCEKEFYVYDKQENFISCEKGIARYAKEHGLSRTGIVTALNGRSKSSGGLIFSYNIL